MRTACALLGALGCLSLVPLAACDRANEKRRASQPTTGDAATKSAAPASDNTARNAHDSAAAKTPLDQGESESDRRITAEIRKAVMGDPTMSMNGQNCKIITKEGVVTLRGPVDSEAEKTAIESHAKAAGGVASVVNELEVKTASPR